MNVDGSVEHFKARLVAKGYSQRPGVDFTETLAPTVHYSAVRTILALAGLEDVEIHSLDIVHLLCDNSPTQIRDIITENLRL